MALDLRIIIGDEDLDIVKTFDKENIYDIRGKKIILNDRYEELNELFELGILDDSFRNKEILIVNSIIKNEI